MPAGGVLLAQPASRAATPKSMIRRQRVAESRYSQGKADGCSFMMKFDVGIGIAEKDGALAMVAFLHVKPL